MADGIGRIAAIGQDVLESLEAADTLVLAESDEEIGELMFRDGKFSYCFGEGNEDGMARDAVVASIELKLPLVEQRQGASGIADFVAKIVGDAAIGIDVQEILTKLLGEEPGGNGKVFVMRAGELGAVFVGGRE